MMKFIKLGVISLISLLAFAACNTGVENECIDPITGEACEPPPIPVYPLLVKVDSTGFLTDDIFVQPSSTFHILIKGTKGDSLLQTLEIRQNGELLKLDRMSINGVPLRSNPYIFGNTAESNEFLWDVALVAHDDIEKVQYEFILEDETGRQAITDIIVNTKINSLTPPTIELLSEVTPSILGEGSASFEFEIDAIGSPIDSIIVYRASTLEDASKIKLDGITFSSNPMAVDDSDRRGFRKEIEIRSTENSGLQGYTIIFLDSLGTAYTYEIGILVIKPVELAEGIILNSVQTGGTSQGAYDLDNLVEYGITDDRAEIKDNGSVQNTWNQKITAFNNSELAKIDADFDIIETDNQIKDLWEDAEKADISSITGEPKEYTSRKINTGDIYIVKRVNDYFLLKITEISTDANDQFYKMDVKK